ncbi:MAG TPA: hypothetical protein VMF88_14830 [Bacteroidota bacterium]|nr:hypothetical protein [Bacteroidota bacterium]
MALPLGVRLLLAQSTAPSYDERLLFQGMTGVTVGASQQAWNLKEEGNVVEQSAPAMISIPLSNRILISVANSPAISKLDTLTLQGVADTRVGFSYVLPGDAWWINGGVSLPTGITKLTDDQLTIATLISESSLDYNVPVFGQGTNANLGFAYAYPVQRRLIVGCGASYVYKGEYQPVSVEGFNQMYKPGDEISANIGLDYTSFSKLSRLSADITVTNYFPDKLGGENFIQSGLRFMVLGVYSVKTGPVTHRLLLRTRLRTQSEIFNSGTGQMFKSSQHYEGQYTATWSPVEWFSLAGLAEGKLHTGDQIPFGVGIFETGKAQLASAGVETGFSPASWFSIAFNAKYGTGSVVINNVTQDATGTEFGARGRIQF